MKQLLIAILVTLPFSLQAQQVVSQYSIAVQNPSFEALVSLPETFDCQGQLFQGYQSGTMKVGRNVPGWQRSFDAEIAYPIGIAQWSCLPQAQFRSGNPPDDSAYLPPDGQNVAFIGNHLAIWQDLGVPLQGGTYNLKFYIGNWNYSYPGKVRASITVGPTATTPGHEICHSETWALGAWTQVTLPCDVPGYLTYNGFGWADFGNGHVGISFQHSEGWIVTLDEVSLWLITPAFVHN